MKTTYESGDTWSSQTHDPPLPPVIRPSGSCQTVGRQTVEVSLPVALKPHTQIGRVETECCGDPTVLCHENRCTHLCEFLICQKICVKIPVTYSTRACAGDPSIFCHHCCRPEECHCCCEEE